MTVETEPQVKRNAKGQLMKGGKTPNPRGRPRGALSMTDTLRKYLLAHPDFAEKIIESLVKVAKDDRKFGNLQAINEVFDRIDGKPTEHRVIEGELPITIQFVPAAQLIEGEFRELVSGS